MPRSPARLLAVVTAVSFWFVGTSQALGAVGNVLPGQGSRAPRAAAASEPVVDAEVLGISVVRRADGSRAVHAEIRTDEVLRLELRVIRYQSVIARIAVRRLRPDRWLVTLAGQRRSRRLVRPTHPHSESTRMREQGCCTADYAVCIASMFFIIASRTA